MAASLALTFLLAAAAVCLAAPAAGQDAPSTIHVEVNGDEVTVAVRDALLAAVLEIIGERAGVEMTLRGDVSAPVTESFAGLRVEDAIRRLARGHSVAVTYAASRGEPGREVLTGVWVVAASSSAIRASSAPRPASGPAEPADTNAAPATGEPPLAPWIGQIERLAGEADRGSEAAMVVLAEIGASETDAAVRHQAVAALGRLRTPAAEPVLVAALADTDVTVRVRAVRGLRGFGTDSAVQSLAELSLGDADPRVRLAAVTALASLPGDSMLRGLTKASTDPDEVVRAVAAQGLAWWKTRWPGGR